MTSPAILSVVTFLYLGGTFLYICYVASRNDWVGKCATGVTTMGLLGQIIAFLLRWKESYELGYGRIPLSNQYESMVFFAMVIMLVYLSMEFKYNVRTIGAFVTPFASLMLALTTLTDAFADDIQPLIPALQSNWLAYHVTTCFLGYAAFAVSCGVSIMFLVKNSSPPETNNAGTIGKLLPPIEVLEDLNYKAIAVGFPMLTLGIITGAVWAEYAWGSYWSWDPKETWSLITWFVYATFLHARIARGWRGKRAAILSIIGFLSVLFTYFGVNYLLAGLHSYA